MRNHTKIILFIVTLIITVAGVVIMQQTVEQKNPLRVIQSLEDSNPPSITEVKASIIEQRRAGDIHIAVKGGDTPVAINETLLTITTNNGTESYMVFTN